MILGMKEIWCASCVRQVSQKGRLVMWLDEIKRLGSFLAAKSKKHSATKDINLSSGKYAG
jgi:hypothetical protein